MSSTTASPAPRGPAQPEGSGNLRTLDLRVSQGIIQRLHLPETSIDDAAAGYQRPTGPVGQRPAWFLVTAGLIDESEWADQIAEHFGLLRANTADFVVDRDLVEKVPEPLARRHEVLPLADLGEEVYVGTTNPSALQVFDTLRRHLGAPVTPVVLAPSELEDALNRLYMPTDVSDLEHLQTDDKAFLSEAEVAHIKAAGEEDQVVELVDRLLSHAIALEASDIHLEPFDDGLHVRLRVDGMLREAQAYPKRLAAAVASRIKVLANLDISERFVPQDGRLRLRRKETTLDLRISSMPVVHGEKVCIRLLGSGAIGKPLAELGLREDVLAQLREQLARPHGMVLVTGPTGSGKSTTLYGALMERVTPSINVVTVEDPVEYEIRGLNQVPVNPKRGITFAKALRAILRQDPDVVLVGEIRDRETALIAAEAAITGHLLLSTLHTNDAASAVTRLVELGVPPHMVAPSLAAVLAQRLVRTVCEGCRRAVRATKESMRAILPGISSDGIHFVEGAGCTRCDGTGYRGRVAVQELLIASPAIRRLIIDGASATRIDQQARSEGMTGLREAALERLFAGETTVEEVIRVTTD